jgi:nucleoside-diphosphate-sugar epimerase
VGASLVRYLLSEGHEVAASIRRGGARTRLEGVDSVYEADIDVRRDVDRVLSFTRPDWVFNLAAHGAYSWQVDRDRIFSVNVRGAFNVLNASLDAGVASLVHAGSSSEYGPRDSAPREEDPLAPATPYAATKAAATTLHTQAAIDSSSRVVTVRLYSIYGPLEDERRFIPTLVRHALGGTLPPLVSPDTPRDFVFIDDACAAFVLAARGATSAIYNVASGRQSTVGEVVALARELFGVVVEPTWGGMAPRVWDTDVWVGDPTRIERELGWSARTPLAEGLRSVAAWIASGER